MPIHPVRSAFVVVAALLLSSSARAQWLTQPTAGIPRSADGTPNFSAAVPRTHDGKPDLSGLWHATPKYDSDFTASDALSWAQVKVRERDADPAADSWATLCLPPGPMINFTGPLKIIQTPHLVTVLYEVPNNFRQIFMDGRALPVDPSPTWQGYSVGRWERDVLVVETIGFNDKSLVGRPAHPHTEALRITERYRRRDFGHIDLQMTVDDPKTFARSWSVTTELAYDADTELLEFVCNENEKDRQHFVHTPSSQTSEIRVDPAVLTKYTGVYEVMTPRGKSTATVSVQGDQLMVDVIGFGSGRMVPQTSTMFAFRGAIIEFVPNETGQVTHLIVHAVEGSFKGSRLDAPQP
ncbi:MAG TPA: hypothetical protein VGF24_10775 [Vicinamibacterales bacterium]|jgi:hypothetical protein